MGQKMEKEKNRKGKWMQERRETEGKMVKEKIKQRKMVRSRTMEWKERK